MCLKIKLKKWSGICWEFIELACYIMSKCYIMLTSVYTVFGQKITLFARNGEKKSFKTW